jgi:uncharacterized protein (DUF2344 family)
LTSTARYNVTTHRKTAEALNSTITSDEKTYNEKLVDFTSIHGRNDEVSRITVQVNTLVNQTLVSKTFFACFWFLAVAQLRKGNI